MWESLSRGSFVIWGSGSIAPCCGSNTADHLGTPLLGDPQGYRPWIPLGISSVGMHRGVPLVSGGDVWTGHLEES